jgi:hypothetical protein
MDGHRHVDHDQSIQCWLKQGRVVPVGRGGNHSERDPRCIDGQRALEALLASIDGAASGLLAAARRLGDAAIDGEVGQLQAAHAVVETEHEIEQGIHHADGNPRGPAPAQHGCGAGVVSDAVVGAPEHQDLHQFVEEELVGNAGTMTAERMANLMHWQQRGELVPDGLTAMEDGTAGMGTLLTRKA